MKVVFILKQVVVTIHTCKRIYMSWGSGSLLNFLSAFLHSLVCSTAVRNSRNAAWKPQSRSAWLFLEQWQEWRDPELRVIITFNIIGKRPSCRWLEAQSGKLPVNISEWKSDLFVLQIPTMENVHRSRTPQLNTLVFLCFGFPLPAHFLRLGRSLDSSYSTFLRSDLWYFCLLFTLELKSSNAFIT